MSTLYCPKCASQIVEGQRFCRNCGTNVGVILDAMAGKRGPIDFDKLKEDMRQLGSSLRSGFEEARENMKKTHRFGAVATPDVPGAQMSKAEAWRMRREEKRQQTKAMRENLAKQKYSPRPRKYSLQQAMLSIFSGGMTSWVLFNLLNTAAGSGLLQNLERVMVRNLEMPEVTGWVPVFQMLWIIGLIPVAKGVAHLINGIFFAPKPARESSEQPAPAAPSFIQEPSSYIDSGVSTPTNEFEHDFRGGFPPSVTEEPTAQFVPHKPVTSDQ